MIEISFKYIDDEVSSSAPSTGRRITPRRDKKNETKASLVKPSQVATIIKDGKSKTR